MRVAVFYHRKMGECWIRYRLQMPNSASALARLLRDQSRLADASALMDPVYDRFSEGFETADLKSAKTLLDALGHAQ